MELTQIPQNEKRPPRPLRIHQLKPTKSQQRPRLEISRQTERRLTPQYFPGPRQPEALPGPSTFSLKQGEPKGTYSRKKRKHHLPFHVPQSCVTTLLKLLLYLVAELNESTKGFKVLAGIESSARRASPSLT